MTSKWIKHATNAKLEGEPQRSKRRGTTGLVAFCLLLMVLLGVNPGTQAVVPTDLTISGSEYADIDGPFEYTGTLTLDGMPFPLQQVEVFVEGVSVAQTLTGLNGDYEVSFIFPEEGYVDVLARAFVGTPEEVESEPVEVIVGNPEISLAGPAALGRFEPAGYSGKLTVAGDPIPARVVDVSIDGTSMASNMTDSTGAFEVSFTFPGRGYFDVLALALEATPAESQSDILEAAVGIFAQIDAGAEHTCGVIPDGGARCWGYGPYGRIGDGTYSTRAAPVAVTDLTNATEISAGGGHTCAVLEDGSVRCWGRNWYGQLGDGTETGSNTPVTVSGLVDAVSVTTGEHHTCALLGDATVRCWGRNGVGELGDGSSTSSNTPVQVTGLSGVVEIDAGYRHTCAVLTDGSAWCWGSNFGGQLGDGTLTHRHSPVRVLTLSGATDIAAGESFSTHTCALMVDKTVRCWGTNFNGQVGDGSTTRRTIPVAVDGLDSAISIATGPRHSCAALEDGSGRCWGYNRDGVLGDGTQTTRLTPVVVSGLTDAVEISAGGIGSGFDAQSCALLSDGAAYCWGNNKWGQLGGAKKFRALTPDEVLY